MDTTTERDRYRASAHYVWRLDAADILGEGAFGVVYRGFHKETCQNVAVKTFNKLSLKKPLGTQMREMNILEKLNHPNVVKLIAIEEEISVSRHKAAASQNSLDGKVLITEYCTEGNLYSILEQPDNQFGLEESELLRVLSHTTGGMKYLRENKIVHRDWKPSNILKTVTKEGEILYKLCDFGAARELDDNQPFLSIVGTEEYIPPDIYGRALLGQGYIGQSFSATSELWSFGVTLYHVTTGHLPYKPYGGRTNRTTMYQIISKKPAGVISGVQETENGPINYSSNLPKHCRLSKQCNKFITYLLCNLFEIERTKMWAFEEFFAAVDELLSKVKISCVTLDSATEFIYIDKSAGMKDFNRLIKQQFDLADLTRTNSVTGDDNLKSLDKHNILYYCDSSFLGDAVWSGGQKCVLEELARCASRSPVLILTRQNETTSDGDTSPKSLVDAVQFPASVVFNDDDVGGTSSLSSDYDISNKCTALIVWASKSVKDKMRCRSLSNKAACLLLTRLQTCHKTLLQRWKLLNNFLDFLNVVLLTTKNGFEESQIRKLEKNMTDTGEKLKSLKADLDESEARLLESLNKKVVMKESNILDVLDNSFGLVFDITQQFRNDKVMYRHVNEAQSNELKWHGLQKKQLKDIWNNVNEKLACDPLDSDLKQYSDLFSLLINVRADVCLFDQKLDVIENMVFRLENHLKQAKLKASNVVDPAVLKNDQLKAGKMQENVKYYKDLAAIVNNLRELRKIAEQSRQFIHKASNFLDAEE